MIDLYSNRHPIYRIFGIVVFISMMSDACADSNTMSSVDHEWFESILGVPKETALTISDQEKQSLGCIIGGVGTVLGTIILSSTAIIVTGGRSAATATEIAVPVLAAAAMAGCVVGNSASLGLAWISRNREKLFGKIVDSIPTEPLKELLPKSSQKPDDAPTK